MLGSSCGQTSSRRCVMQGLVKSPIRSRSHSADTRTPADITRCPPKAQSGTAIAVSRTHRHNSKPPSRNRSFSRWGCFSVRKQQNDCSKVDLPSHDQMSGDVCTSVSKTLIPKVFVLACPKMVMPISRSTPLELDSVGSDES